MTVLVRIPLSAFLETVLLVASMYMYWLPLSMPLTLALQNRIHLISAMLRNDWLRSLSDHWHASTPLKTNVHARPHCRLEGGKSCRMARERLPAGRYTTNDGSGGVILRWFFGHRPF